MSTLPLPDHTTLEKVCGSPLQCFCPGYLSSSFTPHLFREQVLLSVAQCSQVAYHLSCSLFASSYKDYCPRSSATASLATLVISKLPFKLVIYILNSYLSSGTVPYFSKKKIPLLKKPGIQMLLKILVLSKLPFLGKDV